MSSANNRLSSPIFLHRKRYECVKAKAYKTRPAPHPAAPVRNASRTTGAAGTSD
jgi:hypothetical protein